MHVRSHAYQCNQIEHSSTVLRMYTNVWCASARLWFGKVRVFFLTDCFARCYLLLAGPQWADDVVMVKMKTGSWLNCCFVFNSVETSSFIDKQICWPYSNNHSMFCMCVWVFKVVQSICCAASFISIGHATMHVNCNCTALENLEIVQQNRAIENWQKIASRYSW